MRSAAASLLTLLLLAPLSPQTAGYWRFGPSTEPPRRTADVDGVHNGLGGIGTSVATPRSRPNSPTRVRTDWHDRGHRAGGGSERGADSAVTEPTPTGRTSVSICLKSDSSDAELGYAVLVPADDAGPELAFRFGDGVAITTVVSALSIDDLDWHHVSVAYDASAGIVRFGLDGQYDVASATKPNYPNSLEGGPLEIGGRRTATNAYNQFLRGRIDELRISRGFLATDRLLTAPSRDCDLNGVPDDTDLSTNPGLDCDGRGRHPDIVSRPNRLQRERRHRPLRPFRYVLDDGLQAQVIRHAPRG